MKIKYLKELFPFWFIGALCLYIFVLWSRVVEWGLPVFINNHLNDFLCIPVVLHLSLFFTKSIKKNSSFHLQWKNIIPVVLLFAFLFEWFLPMMNSGYVSDIKDVIAYFLGALIYQLFSYLTK
ncbi:MAG: hypothetical protein N4A45_00805 [Flavobacteriales bacterium]|jgi:hypothetical protein|nr:hypothetical protein [Flavobacteriales bacterium]